MHRIILIRRIILIGCISLLILPCPAEEARGRPDAAYQIPQAIFVGDPGRLVLPLSSALAGAGNTVLEGRDELPKTQDLIVSRIELENRRGNHRLIVDFTAFAPGVLVLPPITIAGLTFTDLEVAVASILEAGGNALVLSGPAPPLTVPGTMGMIYGTALGIAVFIAALVLLIFRGGPAFRQWRERFSRRRVIRSMGRVLRYLRNILDKEGPGSASGVLDRLSGEFKTFLVFFTGTNCRAMTGEEFLFLPSLTLEPSGPFLRDFFRRCEALRFSGVEIKSGDVTALLNQVEDFIGKMASGEPAVFEKPMVSGKPEEKAV
jgi:hypothetical protein